MALYVKQNDSRSELQQRIAKELQEKAKKKALETERPDGVSDSAYIKNTKQTGGLAGVWIGIGLFVIGLIVWLAISSTS
jgi:uncharacterized membrane protein